MADEACWILAYSPILAKGLERGRFKLCKTFRVSIRHIHTSNERVERNCAVYRHVTGKPVPLSALKCVLVTGRVGYASIY
jgi:hypothetical protein